MLLLAQHREPQRRAGRGLDDDVIALGAGGPEPVHAAGLQQAAVNDLVQQPLPVIEDLAGGGLLEYRRIAPLQLPGGEEELPVDEVAQQPQVWLEDPGPGAGGHGQLAEVQLLPVRPRLCQRHQWPPLSAGMLLSQALLLVPVGPVQLGRSRRVQQVGHHADHARGIQDMHRRTGVSGRDAHGRVLLGRGRAADQQGQTQAAALHLLGDAHHLVQGRRDQAGQPDRAGALGHGGVQDLRGGHHHAQVDHVVVVAAEHHADDVLADVVHVALDRGHDDPALRAPGLGQAGLDRRLLLRFHEGLEVGHRPLHRAGALHHLRQEHLAGAEEVTDDLHALHQRTLDDIQRPVRGEPGLLGVGLHEVHDAVHERVRQPLLDRRVPPGEVYLALGAAAPDGVGEGHQPVGGIGPPVKDHVLDQLQQLRLDVLIDHELTGVHDAHVEPGFDGVEQERGVHRFADDVISAE